MPEVPAEFSVVPQHQVIPGAIVSEISDFIRIFDRVTAREAWQAAALCGAGEIAQPVIGPERARRAVQWVAALEQQGDMRALIAVLA